MADRTLYGAFVVALVLRLREQGLRVSPADADAAAMLARTVEGWDREQLWTVLRSVLVKRAQDRPIFDTEFARGFDRPAEEIVQPAPTDPATPEETDTAPRRAFPGSRLLGTALRLTRGMKRVAKLAVGAVAAGIVVYLVAERELGRKPPPAPAPGSDTGGARGAMDVFAFDLGEPSMILGGGVALLVCVAGLLAWRRWWADEAGEVREAKAFLHSDAEATGDETTFRVGSLGGAPPRFLSPLLAAELAEILTYRLSDAASPDIDIAGTIGGHMRGEEPAGIVYQRRRELPTVVVLVDTASSARHWHTLADEFLAELAQRGVAHERIEFAGSFYERRLGRLEPRREAGEIEAAIAAPGWTVTTVFAEAHSLSPVDVRLLRSLAENGPMLFLDHRDLWLWDARHAALMAAGVPVVPATARRLYEGLARIFAPDRAPAEKPFLPRRRKRASQAAANMLPAMLIETLGEDGLAWASECALVQPVSFALAEQLRQRHSSLENELAFSRLAALPGSWLGPEGLRFGGQVRRQLLSHFAGQPEGRRAGAVAVIDAAFRTEPEEETANALWRYARAQVQLFGTNTDAALRSIGDIRQQGLIDADAIDHLTKSLRWDGEAGRGVGAGDVIRLPNSPIRGATRRRLAGEPEREDQRGRAPAPDRPPGERQIEEASWTIEIPESRIKIGEKIVLASPGAVAPAASFLSGGRFLLVDGHWWRNEPGLFLVDALLGIATQVATPPVIQGPIDGIWTASEAPVAMVLFRGNLLVLPYEARANGVPQFRREFRGSAGGEAIATDAMPLVAVSPDGGLVAFQHAPDRMRVTGIAETNRSLSGEMQFRSPILSIAFADGRGVLVGLQGGEILRLTFEGSEWRQDQIGHTEGGATALAAVGDDNGEKRGIAALSDGRVAMFGAPDTGTLRLPFVTRRIVPFPDRSALLAIRQNSDGRGEARELGLSAIVIGQEGECDVIGLFGRSRDDSAEAITNLLGPSARGGLPLWSLLERDILPARDGMRVLALSGQSRRLAVLRGRTIEIRPLGYRLDVPAGAELARPAERPMAEAAEPEAA